MSDNHPLIVVAGPTASGKTALALHLAETMGGEIVSCDSVAVYRMFEIGSAKPTAAERARVRHHGLDLFWPNEPCTAGDYARAARAALQDIRERGKVAIVAGGTGLYLRALLEGLAPAPLRNESLRAELRAQNPGTLHARLLELDPKAAAMIHPNDKPKLIRSIEVSLAAGVPQTEQWNEGREPLKGFRIIEIGLNPPRKELYARIDARAAAMFANGLLEETAAIRERFGEDCHALTSLGYKQAMSLLRGELELPEAIAEAQQGHRNYAKRQMTWFRRSVGMRWLEGFGDDTGIQALADEMFHVEHLNQ